MTRQHHPVVRRRSMRARGRANSHSLMTQPMPRHSVGALGRRNSAASSSRLVVPVFNIAR
jgi:hypothetical protein